MGRLKVMPLLHSLLVAGAVAIYFGTSGSHVQSLAEEVASFESIHPVVRQIVSALADAQPSDEGTRGPSHLS